MSQPPSPLNKNVQASLLEILQAEPTTLQLEHALRLLAKWRAKLIHNTILQKTGHIIKYGPFAGMNYDVAASEGGGAPRLLGGYEVSLAPIINDIVEAKPDLIIISAGFDAHRADPLATLTVETDDFAALTDDIIQLAEETSEGRILSLLEGGYDLTALANSCAVHLDRLSA